jgi:hypothetical protein
MTGSSARLGPVQATTDGDALVLAWPLWPRARRPLLALALAVVWPAVFFALAPALAGAWGIALGFAPTLALVLGAAPALSRALVRRRAVVRCGAAGYEIPRGLLLDPSVAARALPWLEEIRRQAPAPGVEDPSPFVVATTAGHRPLVLVLWRQGESQLVPIFCEEGHVDEERTAFAGLCATFFRAPVLDL